jgi:DNA polymerase/3'-5' exonuclease PolX
VGDRSIPLAHAGQVARELAELLQPACARIRIAGSIRRLRAQVKDIELVVQPRVEERDAGWLWGGTQPIDLLAERLRELYEQGLVPRPVEVHRRDGSVETQERLGESYQALEWRDLPVDLFIVRPPAEWGVIFAIRTGPGDFNQRLVTECQRFGRRVAGGQVLALGRPVPCPEEEDFFRALGQRWLEPVERHPDLVRIEPTLLQQVPA